MQKSIKSSVCNFPEFKEWLEAGAKAGEGYAHWKLALSYLDGSFGTKSVELAVEHLRAAMGLGVPFAPHCLAQLIQAGIVNLEVDETLLDLYLNGSLSGHEASMEEAARIYMRKAILDPNELIWARKLLQQLVWNGHKHAKVELQFIEALNAPTLPNKGEMQLLARRIGIEGNAAALRAYGTMVTYGYSSTPDHSLGLAIWQDALDRGCVEAALDLYEHSLHTPSYALPQTAQSAMEKLIKASHPEALYLYALHLFSSDEPFSQTQARSHLKKATQLGHALAAFQLAKLEWDINDQARRDRAFKLANYSAQVGLGLQVTSQLGAWAFELIQNKQEMDASLVQLVSKAARYDSVQAMNLSIWYAQSEVLTNKDDLIYFWFAAAALDGHSDATRLIAIDILNSKEADGRQKELVTPFLEYSANMDNAYACALLGDLFYDGTPLILKNPAQAAKWYHKGALLNYKYCQNELSKCYRNGVGVTADFDKATFWEGIYQGESSLDDFHTLPEFDQNQDADRNFQKDSAVIPFRSRGIG